ncbi:MAG TPA: 2TM domain-containing protein [Crinalium sp.]|jgi:hypothetical protein
MPVTQPATVESVAMPDFYSQEDVQQILHLAIARQTDTGEMTRTQLVEIADELGISALDLQLAEQEWIERRSEDEERQAFYRFQLARLKQQGFKYLVINGFLIALNVLTSGGISWALYVALGWGVLLALKAWKSLQTDGDDYEEAFQNWRRRRWIKRSVKRFWDRWMKV